MISGKVIVVEMKLQKLPGINKKEFPQDYKFNLIAYNKVNEEEYILVDNHDRKEPHWHDDNHEEFFSWVSWEVTLELFLQKTIKKFGSFQKKANK